MKKEKAQRECSENEFKFSLLFFSDGVGGYVLHCLVDTHLAIVGWKEIKGGAANIPPSAPYSPLIIHPCIWTQSFYPPT